MDSWIPHHPASPAAEEQDPPASPAEEQDPLEAWVGVDVALMEQLNMGDEGGRFMSDDRALPAEEQDQRKEKSEAGFNPDSPWTRFANGVHAFYGRQDTKEMTLDKPEEGVKGEVAMNDAKVRAKIRAVAEEEDGRRIAGGRTRPAGGVGRRGRRVNGAAEHGRRRRTHRFRTHRPPAAGSRHRRGGRLL